MRLKEQLIRALNQASIVILKKKHKKKGLKTQLYFNKVLNHNHLIINYLNLFFHLFLFDFIQQISINVF